MSNTSNKHVFLLLTLITTPLWDLQMLIYLELMEMWGREKTGGVFLWVVSSIKISVIALYVMGKCQKDVFVSVFCDARESMDSWSNGENLCNSAESLYFLEIPRFTLVEDPEVFKNNVGNIYSASPKLCIFFVLKVIYVQLYTLFLS